MGWCKLMNNLKNIMELIHWDRDEQDQEKGRKLASQVEDISVFLQDNAYGGKAVWENCALILVEESDDRLEQYLPSLLEWLQDFNWPGALIILDRLKVFTGEKLKNPFIKFVKNAINIKNEEGLMWLDNLSELLDNEGLKAELPSDILKILQKHYHNWTWWYSE